MSSYPEIAVEHRNEQPYVGVTKTVTTENFAPVAGQLPEIIGWLASEGIALAGAPFLRYRVIDMERELLVQAGVPIAHRLANAGDLEADVLPAGRYVTTTYTGGYDDLIDVTWGLLQWAEARELSFDMHPSADGDVRGARLEFFDSNPLEVPDPAQCLTTLAFRLVD